MVTKNLFLFEKLYFFGLFNLLIYIYNKINAFFKLIRFSSNLLILNIT